MFNFSFGEMTVVAILALILIGPKQLPEIARTVGRFLNELKRTGEDISGHFLEVRDQIGQEVKQARADLQEAKSQVAEAVQEINAIPSHFNGSRGEDLKPPPLEEKLKVADGWKKLQIKSEISHSMENTKIEKIESGKPNA